MFPDFAGHGWIAWMRDSKITFKCNWSGSKSVARLMGVKTVLELVDSRHLVFEPKVVRGPSEYQSARLHRGLGSH